MKPWQAKWYEFKRLNPNREVIACLVILLGCAAVFFLMPSARTTRIAKAEAKLAQFIKSRKGRIASPSEVKEIIGTNKFTIRRIQDAPTIYLFIPSLNNNIAVLGRLHNVRPGIDGYTVFLIPRSGPESPTSEHSVGMCLLKQGTWKVNDLVKSAPNILASKAEIESNWSKVSENEKASIAEQLSRNEAIHKKLNGMSTLIDDGKRAYLFEDWSNASDLLDRLNELHRSGG